MGTHTTTVSRPKSHPQPPPSPLIKQKSWSPESHRDELWLKRSQRCGSRRSKSLTDEDVDELKACLELGFRFDSPDLQPDPRLSLTLPALDFYLTVNRTYNDTVLKSNKSSSSSSSSSDSDLSLSSPAGSGSPLTMFSPGEDPKTIKTRLRHWAQVVACSVRQSW